MELLTWWISCTECSSAVFWAWSKKMEPLTMENIRKGMSATTILDRSILVRKLTFNSISFIFRKAYTPLPILHGHIVMYFEAEKSFCRIVQ